VTFVVVCRGGRGGERVDAADPAADGVVIVSDATMQQRTRLRGELNVAQLRLAQRGKHQCGIRNDGIIVMTGNAVTFVGVIKPLIRAAILICRRVGPKVAGLHVLVELLREGSASPTAAAVLTRRRRHVIAHCAAAVGAEMTQRRVGLAVNRPRRIPLVATGRQAQRTAVSAGVASVSAPSRIRGR